MTHPVEYSHAFQPIVDIETREVVSYEVLLRGKRNEPPAVVFGQLPSDSWMAFDQASRQRAIELAANLGVQCGLSLNFTPGAILHDGGKYPFETIAVARQQGMKANRLILEITESEAIHSSIELVGVLNALRRTGVTIAIDDFGAGYAGLNLLADVQPHMIKLDMHLLRGIDGNGPRQSIVKAIATACVDLGVDVLAEGVETKEELGFLMKQGVKLYQGYLFARPGFECLPAVSLPAMS